MIEVEHLTKRFGALKALDDVSFSVNTSEIVGLLGPNGAGKTTIMRILTTFLTASEGTCRVCGFDVFRQHADVRRRIGYLPEQAPLYDDQRVTEYLFYRARLKGLKGRRMRRRVTAVIDACGLGNSQRRIIGQLSKGYRQRVGLADAMLSEPELLVLDEPTIGLDPHQIRQIRGLIRDVGREHTVLLSSHILSEVEAVCARVLIMRRGRIVAADTTQHLMAQGGGARLVLELQHPPETAQGLLEALAGVGAVSMERKGEWCRFSCECDGAEPMAASVHALVVREGWSLRELRMEERRLEDVFVELTSDGKREVVNDA